MNSDTELRKAIVYIFDSFEVMAKEGESKQVVDAFEALIKSEQQKLLDRLEEGLPEKKLNAQNASGFYQFDVGFDTALTQVTQLLTKAREAL